MNNFIYPIQALTNSFQLQTIARFDLVLFVLDDEATKYIVSENLDKHGKIDNFDLSYMGQ